MNPLGCQFSATTKPTYGLSYFWGGGKSKGGSIGNIIFIATLWVSYKISNTKVIITNSRDGNQSFTGISPQRTRSVIRAGRLVGVEQDNFE